MTHSPAELLRRRQAALARLQKAAETIRGTLLERFLPCGKRGCRCKSGGPLHGPAYFLSVSYAAGKRRQVYVRQDAKPVVEQWVANYQEVWAALEEISSINVELIRLKAVP